jgi:hypothetical protein
MHLNRVMSMTRKAALKRKAFFVDEAMLKRAQKALGVRTQAEVVRVAVERAAEMEKFWRFMKRTRALLEPGSVEAS